MLCYVNFLEICFHLPSPLHTYVAGRRASGRSLHSVAVLTSTLGGPTALPHECKPELPAYKNHEGVVVCRA